MCCKVNLDEPGDSSADRCGGSAGWAFTVRRRPSLLPVELRHVNHAASTNERDFRVNHHVSKRIPLDRSYNARLLMASTTPIDQIADRVERLLLRHAELQRANALLTQEVATLTAERDSLRSRLSAARARVDALLDRLPEQPPTAAPPKETAP